MSAQSFVDPVNIARICDGVRESQVNQHSHIDSSILILIECTGITELDAMLQFINTIQCLVDTIFLPSTSARQ